MCVLGVSVNVCFRGFFRSFRLYYPDPHPARGVQLMRVGKLQHLLGGVEEALKTFRQVSFYEEKVLKMFCHVTYYGQRWRRCSGRWGIT